MTPYEKAPEGVPGLSTTTDLVGGHQRDVSCTADPAAVSALSHRHLPPRVTRSYREFAFYLASLPCECPTSGRRCAPCAARMTITRVTREPSDLIVKHCPRCKQFKRGTAFSIDSSKPDGLQLWCKVCHRGYDNGKA